MSFENITPGEKIIIDNLRELKPFESVKITADSQGKPDTFIIHRETKVLIRGQFANNLNT